MLVIRTRGGAELRIPVQEIETMTEVEPATSVERPPPPHAYLHREGVNRCAACWRERTHPSHTDTAVHG